MQQKTHFFPLYFFYTYAIIRLKEHKMKQKITTLVRKKTPLKEPKTFLTINKKLYRAIDPRRALAVAKKLTTGQGIYKVHVIYGKEQISKRKTVTVENEGKYKSAKEARIAIRAFLDSTLWMRQS
jgi:hypothetical protein